MFSRILTANAMFTVLHVAISHGLIFKVHDNIVSVRRVCDFILRPKLQVSDFVLILK